MMELLTVHGYFVRIVNSLVDFYTIFCSFILMDSKVIHDSFIFILFVMMYKILAANVLKTGLNRCRPSLRSSLP